MNAIAASLHWICLATGGWLTLNGVLHDIFVLASDHGKKYDRDLLRLLMDGHILITCGIVLMLCFPGLRSGQQFFFYIAALCLVSIIGYCFMIWPFLKSIGTLVICTACLIAVVFTFFTTPTSHV
ncbi:MAG TPA: hypothetical protein VFU15_10635 [Bacteroidia bacterium]|nr:hypothetical protein [Bacteroidia bacterium]